MATRDLTGFSLNLDSVIPGADYARAVSGTQPIVSWQPSGATYWAAGSQPSTQPAQPPPPVADPAYAKVTGSFGVLQQVDAVHDLFLNAKRGILDLREVLRTAPSTREQALIGRIRDYVERYVTAEELRRYLRPFEDDGELVLPDLDEDLADPGTTRTVPVFSAGTSVQQQVTENEHSALFRTGRVMVKEIRTTDALRYGLSMIRRLRQRELARRREELAELEASIPEETRALASLNTPRIEARGDYAVAQRLVAEDWARVERAWGERRRVLESNLGLYYVRVRETPLSLTLPDPLALRRAAADDLVPGCPLEAAELPEELEPFMEAVLDVPVGDWAVLSGLHHLLPGRGRLEVLVQQRRQRLTLRRDQDPLTGGSGLASRLAPLYRQGSALTRELLARPFTPTGALSQVQAQGRDLLSLEDLLSGPPHRLRARARDLHGRLGAAAACLTERLRTVAPSLRLDWAAAAESGRLPVEEPARWPGLERAEAADFNGVRTLVELVDWWFRQLAPGAAAASRAALRNYLRACLLFAAQDDPTQILRGSLTTAPGRLHPGVPLRLKLNREALPGTLLQVADPAGRVVGTLRVDDHDDLGTVASVLQVIDTAAEPDTAFQVTGIVAALKL
jgi:hypothetical protein